MSPFLLAIAALVPLIFNSTPVEAAGKPTALHASCGSTVEGGTAPCTLSKSGGNGKALTVAWNAGNAKGQIILTGTSAFAVNVPIPDDAIVNGTRTVQFVATSSAASTSAAITVTDNDVAPAPPPPVVTPPPPAPPPPTDADAPGGVNDPLVGVAYGEGAPTIDTADHNVMDDLQANQPIPIADPSGTGALRFLCRPTGLSYDDHVVFYHQPGMSHLHQQSGPYVWSANSNYGNLRLHGDGSGCNDVAGFDRLGLPPLGSDPKTHWSANRTAYEQPALLDGKGHVILPNWVEFYYKQDDMRGQACSGWVPPTGDKTKQTMGKCVPLPNGLKFLFGAHPENSALPSDAAFTFQCVNGNAVPYSGNDLKTAVATCRALPTGGEIHVRGDAPECWNGHDLDSLDHRSHMARAYYGNGYGYLQCPQDHPLVVPTFTYIVSYTILPGDDGDIHFASDEMDNSKPRGWSFHVDYGPMAWDRRVWDMIQNDGCLGKVLNCNAGDLGNGYRLKGAAVPIYVKDGIYQALWLNPVRLVPMPPKPAM